jgi:hypothetical protein
MEINRDRFLAAAVLAGMLSLTGCGDDEPEEPAMEATTGEEAPAPEPEEPAAAPAPEPAPVEPAPAPEPQVGPTAE